MATTSYITPITNRKRIDVEYAKIHQDDLVNKNRGAWNYTDANRVCNNLKYAAEHMYDEGFLDQPYSMQIKTNWKETDIITYEQLNEMIVNNMNNLKSYSRPDLHWNPIASIANMDYNTANWIEQNIDMLATQEPLPADVFVLTVNHGFGSGEYEANTVVTVRADTPEEGMLFDHWSGDHLENMDNPSAAITTYTMPYQDVTLQANYIGTTDHILTVETHTNTNTYGLVAGASQHIEADPAPQGKVFHHWDVEPERYKNNLYEPAATTTFTMPNEDVKLTAVYITKGQKYLEVVNGTGTGWYDYDTPVQISPNLPSDGTFTQWSGDVQYLTGDVSDQYNVVRIPDVSHITIRANWTTPPTPPATNVPLTVVNGTIDETGGTTGTYTEGDRVTITADAIPEGDIFTGWTWTQYTGADVSVNGMKVTVIIGRSAITLTASHRTPEYHNLSVTTNSGTTTESKESLEYFRVNANPAPNGYTFDRWTGDTNSYNGSYFDTSKAETGTYMGTSDRTITATYRQITSHTLTIEKLDGTSVTYTQDEFTTLNVAAETAPAGQRFSYWYLSGEGSLLSRYSESTTFTFGNGDATLVARYVNIWTVIVVNGTINGQSSAVLNEGSSYKIVCQNLAINDRFDGWTQTGATGIITNPSATITYFTVGNGDTTLTANISQYPDKTLTIYMRDPDYRYRYPSFNTNLYLWY